MQKGMLTLITNTARARMERKSNGRVGGVPGEKKGRRQGRMRGGEVEGEGRGKKAGENMWEGGRRV